MKQRRLILAALFCAGGVGFTAIASAQIPPAEQARIDKLIASVAQHKELRFLRNGSDYSAKDAADFLRGKLDSLYGRDVKSVADFIDQIGTKSSMSGDVYKVRLSDGREVPSSEFLRLELARIERR